MNTPKVTVLMPAYNAEKYIAEAIDSILNQTFTDFEYLIIDDGSTDNTWKIIQEYARKDQRIVAVLNEKNLRISATLNRGIDLAKGEYIARMDADDWSYPERLEKQVDFMDKNPDMVVSGGTIEICDSELKFLNLRGYNLDDKNIRSRLFRYSPFCHPSIICKTEVAKKVEGYNLDLVVAEDYDFYFKMGRFGLFGNLEDSLLRLRTHKNSLSATKARRQECLTIYIRIKAKIEYGYRPSLSDVVYTFCQYISIYMIPPRYKFWLFNYFRKKV